MSIPSMGVAIIHAAVGVSHNGTQMWQEVARQPLEMLMDRRPEQGLVVVQTEVSEFSAPSDGIYWVVYSAGVFLGLQGSPVELKKGEPLIVGVGRDEPSP